MRKRRFIPLVRRQTEPVFDALARSEPLNLDGGMRRKLDDGEHCVVDIPERGARADGGGTEEGTVLRSQ